MSRQLELSLGWINIESFISIGDFKQMTTTVMSNRETNPFHKVIADVLLAQNFAGDMDVLTESGVRFMIPYIILYLYTSVLYFIDLAGVVNTQL